MGVLGGTVTRQQKAPGRQTGGEQTTRFFNLRNRGLKSAMRKSFAVAEFVRLGTTHAHKPVNGQLVVERDLERLILQLPKRSGSLRIVAGV